MTYTLKMLQVSNPQIFDNAFKEDLTMILKDITALKTEFKTLFPRSQYDFTISLTGKNGHEFFVRKAGSQVWLDKASNVASLFL